MAICFFVRGDAYGTIKPDSYGRGQGRRGKTSICASIVRLLVEKYPDKKILAIDADPAVGLSVALGVDVKLTLDGIRMSIVDSVENGETREALELLSEARFRIFDALVEMPGFAFLAIGRPESSGCYCKVNSYLKEVISLLANSFDYVVIDGEAGIEQIQRRVMEKVTHLMLVTDQSKKGAQVIGTIKKVADELIGYDRIGVIVNRVTNPELACADPRGPAWRSWPLSPRTALLLPTTSWATALWSCRRIPPCSRE